jgi:competence protein ComEC
VRKLATAAVSFAAAILLSCYILPRDLLPFIAAGLAALSFSALFFQNNARFRIFLIMLGLAAGFLWLFTYHIIFLSPAAELDGTTVSVQAQVCDYPAETDYGSKVTVSVHKLGRPSVKTQLYIYGDGPELEPGNQIAFTARFAASDTVYGEKTESFVSKGIFLLAFLDGEISITDAGGTVFRFPQRIAHTIKSKLSEIFHEDMSAFMLALLLGDTAQLNQDAVLKGAMADTGVTHIISVSGMNIAFLMGMLGLLIKKRRVLALFGIPAILLFMALIGFAAPVTRAGIMQIFLLLAPLFRRENDGITSLSASLALILLSNPYAAAGAGLQLSFAATLGMILYTEKTYAALVEPLKKRKLYSNKYMRCLLRLVTASFSTTAGALVFTVPLTALHFGSVSVIAPVANLVILWAVSLAFCIGVIACLLGFLYTPLGTAAAFIASLPVRFIIRAILLLSGAPVAAVYTENVYIVFWLVYVYLLGFIFFIFREKLRKILYPACAAVMSLCMILIFAAVFSDAGGLSVTALDVGQGQCILLTSGSSTAVVDCGGVKNAGDVAAQYLKSHGRAKIDLLILTHFHKDHTGGVAELLARTNVAAIAMPDPELDDVSDSQKIISVAEEHGIEIIYVVADCSVDMGKTSLLLFAPINEGSNDGGNERGLAILCSDGFFDALITGDMSAANEEKLIDCYAFPDIELLIAGHHGSKYSTSAELLETVTPEAAIISVGYNQYGHPAAETLHRLASWGAVVYRTDELGNVTIKAG